MHAKCIAVYLCAVLAAPVFGGESVDYPIAATKAGTLTRAEVHAEVLRARAAGELDITEATYPWIPSAPATRLTRDEVRAEARRARAAGELDFTEANYPVLTSSPAAPMVTLTRAQVRDDAIRAFAAGKLEFTDAGVVPVQR